MYFINRCKERYKDKNKNIYHEIVVPFIFVALWIAGLALTILNPLLPFFDSKTECSILISSLTYIYIIFIVEVIVTFTDIHNVYRLYNAKKLLIQITTYTILPNIVLNVLAFRWYCHHQESDLLFLFVLFSACIKLEEVWLANNGDTVFAYQQEKMNKENIFIPKEIS